PANSSYPSVLAEMLTATVGAQCMIWETSPAAAELEEIISQWLKKAMDLPETWEGVIQDSASTAAISSLITAREVKSNFLINEQGFLKQEKWRVYCSSEAHSSIEKTIKIIGIGRQNLIKIPTDDSLSMNHSLLEKQIEQDIQNGFTPMAVVATLGTTSTLAFDPIQEIGVICKKYNIWLHVDAAYAGTALLLPEERNIMKGKEYIDSFVFNPHKWMFVNFDCTFHFIKNKNLLIRSLQITPEYLKTTTTETANNYSNWGVQLGRRFRSLKLWFVIRSYGINGLQQTLRKHIHIASIFEQKIKNDQHFQLLCPRKLNTIVFRYNPSSTLDLDTLNKLNEKLLSQLNISGKIYLSHTKIQNIYWIRIIFGNTYLEERHAEEAWGWIQKTSLTLK
ncbi:MAG: pyridoxal-dependent decarboxylase, partial [Chitinophagaceae bacterium]|nr:pyridoxal-dependent decarboxylase [Chitinophagaceae bacterium]